MKEREDVFNLKRDFNPKAKNVNISICKSNLPKGKCEYYARVCRKGRISSDALMQMLAKKCSYISTAFVEMAVKELVDIIVDATSSGYSVDFFSLGTFAMQAKGKININENNDNKIKEETTVFENGNKEKVETMSGDFDVSSIIVGKPKFKLSFEPSGLCKKTFKNVDMQVAVKKRRAPCIEKVEALASNVEDKTYSIIRVTGEDLKVAGDNERCGIYIKADKGEWESMGKSVILQNHPKMLLLALNTKLKYGSSYRIRIATQYVRQGRDCISNILRFSEVEFNCLEPQKDIDHTF